MSRTGYSVALGCIHRYVGGMASGHHLNSSVSILLALAKDSSSSLVQVRYVSEKIFFPFFSVFPFLGVTETYSINYRPFHGFFNF